MGVGVGCWVQFALFLFLRLRMLVLNVDLFYFNLALCVDVLVLLNLSLTSVLDLLLEMYLTKLEIVSRLSFVARVLVWLTFLEYSVMGMCVGWFPLVSAVLARHLFAAGVVNL
ncbi:hypothetical protein DPMN_106975 [Dreissena polymorpha]|uniref:Uncharacterized protein n=1 Tax=Dreissena polymorpha TaxID=45954 RepID=A0A9D4K5W8_DREPO|nr:hypothetical protein DPMN_106975 [Dreissena polymorpha]